MAGILNQVAEMSWDIDGLTSLSSNHGTMFTELQVALASDIEKTPPVPFSLMLSEAKSEDNRNALEERAENIDLVVEDATLQAEFRQLAPLGEKKVTELENFYNTHSAEVVTQRTDAVTKVHLKNLAPEQLQKELSDVNEYYDRQQAHLTLRISKSLQLLKQTLPADLPAHKPDMNKKNNRSRALNSKAVDLMNQWYQEHIEHPYPSDDQKKIMADKGGITVTQVKAWFANKRNRTLNTKPKRQQVRLQHQLNQIATKLSSTADVGHQRGYGLLMEELSNLVHDNTKAIRKMNYINVPIPLHATSLHVQ